MYNGIVHLHNFLRWIILLLLIVAIVRHLIGMISKKPFTAGDGKTGLFLMIAAHTQFLIGVYQWFAGNFGLKILQGAGMSEVMKNSAMRFWVMEHNLTMLIAIILITIGRRVAKKNISDSGKHRRNFWLYLIALALIIAAIPWPGREGISRPIFPGM